MAIDFSIFQDHPAERERVYEKISKIILLFLKTHNSAEYTSTQLYEFVKAIVPIAPSSPDRIHRQMKEDGLIDYDVIDRPAALYRMKGRDGTTMQIFLQTLTDQHGPVARTLSRLIRPSLIAPQGKVLVWGDFSMIEARVLPWLTASPGGEQMLLRFIACDADPSRPDVYAQTAGDILHKDPREVTEAERQAYGKVPVLSLGFGGGVGALLNMATNYNVYLDEDEARDIVARWRAANPWAPAFWDEIWRAALDAKRNPGQLFHAGRTSWVYNAGYMKGSLQCILPGGRVLTYPDFRLETRKVKDKQTGEVEEVTQHTYRKGYGRAGAWHGKFAENVTQAVAGSILRNVLVILEQNYSEWMPVVGHTHDDIVVEVDEGRAEEAAKILRQVMMRNEAWTDGLPLNVKTTCHGWFTKARD